MSQVKPFSPEDARAHVVNVIPAAVLTAVNQLLAENYSAREFTIKQHIIKERALKLMYPDLDAETREVQKFDYKWLNFEPAYERSGWKVGYVKPDYTESFDPYFTFTPKA